MEHALCLHYCTLPNLHFRLPSRPHIGFRHSSLFLSNGSLGRVLRPVTSKPPSTYKKGNDKRGRSGTRAMYAFGSRDALKSLLDVSVYLASNGVESPNPSKPGRIPVPPIKKEAMVKMKNGKSDEAVNILRKEYEDCKNIDPETAYRVEMALVEILIIQGKYKEALDCNCLKDEPCVESDGRFPLYKAIIHTMLNEMEEAEKWWKQFIEVVEEGYDIEID